MKRYNAVVGGVYDNSVMIDERDGDWVWYEDWEALETKCTKLESECAELETKCAELLEACKYAFNSMKHNNCPKDDSVFIVVRAAIAKTEGEAP